MKIINSLEELEQLNKEIHVQPNNNFNYENIEFNTPVLINGANTLSIKNCVFNDDFRLKYSIKHAAFIENNVFNNLTFFDDCVFLDNVRFYSTEFKGTASFGNTKFNKLADFWNVDFIKATIFYKTDFLGTTVFAETRFHKNVLFTYSLIAKLAIFRNTKFYEGFDFSLSLISGNLSWYDIIAKDFKSEDDTNDMEIFGNYVSYQGIITHKNKRESFRIIKNHLQSVQNHIDSLDYYGLELNAHKQELEAKDSKWTDIQLHLDKFVIWLNEVSNNHGQSWTRGVGFTVVSAIIFFYLSIINTENYTVDYICYSIDGIVPSFKYFLSFIMPFHNIDLLIDETPDNWSYFFDFVGRIFVGYGIYQTINSFRKFKLK